VRREAFTAATIIAAVFLSFETVRTGTSVYWLCRRNFCHQQNDLYTLFKHRPILRHTKDLGVFIYEGAKQPKRGADQFRSSFEVNNKYSFTSTLSIRFRGPVLRPRYRCSSLTAPNLAVGFLRTCLWDYYTVRRGANPRPAAIFVNYICIHVRTDRCSTVVKVLCYKSEGHFRSHYGPGVDSASNRNEYQDHFLGIKVAGA